jgi:hypothetical protein
MNRFLTPGQCTTSDLTLIGPYLRILRSDSGSGCHSTRNACTNIFTDRIQHLAEGGNSDFALDVCHGSQIYLAARCGAPRERNGQFRALWCDPPRSPLCREWVVFLCGWHSIVHCAGYWRRGSTPPAPPTIWEFCQRYDLPVPPWATLIAELHRWEHLRPVANRLNSRHAYLVALSRETRLHLYAVESEMRSMERDRQWGFQVTGGVFHSLVMSRSAK